MYSVKEIDIKNRTYCFFDNVINIKNFDPNRSKIDKKSYKNIVIYYNGYITTKNLSYIKIISENHLYFIIIKKWIH